MLQQRRAAKILIRYEDYTFTCPDCKRQVTWAADRQRWYYEVARQPICNVPKVCRECRDR